MKDKDHGMITHVLSWSRIERGGNWNLWKVFVCGLCSGAGSVSNDDDDDDGDGGDDADDGDDAAADDDDADDDGDDDDVCLRPVKSNFIQQMSDILFSYFF